MDLAFRKSQGNGEIGAENSTWDDYFIKDRGYITLTWVGGECWKERIRSSLWTSYHIDLIFQMKRRKKTGGEGEGHSRKKKQPRYRHLKSSCFQLHIPFSPNLSWVSLQHFSCSSVPHLISSQVRTTHESL